MASFHRVAAGDTLQSLARSFYGDATLAPVLAAANDIPPSQCLVAGQGLVIPYVTQHHTVAVGETLYDLAELYYGDGAMFPLLAASNHISGPYLIRPGQRLLVPDLVNVSRHTVYPGDSLHEFAIRWYNDECCDLMIEYANHLAALDDIEIGQTLIRPGLNRRHVVEEAETWKQLSQCWYGDPHLAELIAAANHLPVDQPPPVGRTIFFPDLADF